MWGSPEKIDNKENENTFFWKVWGDLKKLKLCVSTLHQKEVKVWVAPQIPQELRMWRLFPDWVPTKKEEMDKYIVQIRVPIITAEWKTITIPFSIHRKLKNEFISAFQDLKKAWMKISPEKNRYWGYNFRKKREKDELSIHSYWWAIDINSAANFWEYGNGDNPKNPYYITPKFVNIMKKHGFYRWWDRINAKKDPMHFSYTEKPDVA